jgi:hypothetical protein
MDCSDKLHAQSGQHRQFSHGRYVVRNHDRHFFRSNELRDADRDKWLHRTPEQDLHRNGVDPGRQRCIISALDHDGLLVAGKRCSERHYAIGYQFTPQRLNLLAAAAGLSH